MNNELKQIKKIYGEDMMHLCRSLFPTILEHEGRLLSILQNHIAPTHSFANDIKSKDLYDEFKSWIFAYYHEEEKQELVDTGKDPFELMDEAGYKLYECHKEEEIQSFKKYYAPGEVICTIYMGGRLHRCHVFFAVKKNVDQIKREDFNNPQREDEYGTSVISIQFTRDYPNTISIKNRYNHTVPNPDATFSNNLEKIIPGLTRSFEKKYGFKIEREENVETSFLMYMDYVRGRDGRYYRYNLEDDGIFYCENNIIVKDGMVITDYDDQKERYILIDKTVIDLQEKKVFNPFVSGSNNDSFPDSINDLGKIKKITVTKNNENRIITIQFDENKEAKIEIDKHNAIIGYENNYIEEIGDYFLDHNTTVRKVSLNNAKAIGKNFLARNKVLSSISLDKVKTINHSFLRKNQCLLSISLPEVEDIGRYFLCENKPLKEISMPKLRKIDCHGLEYCENLTSLSLPNVIEIGDYFLHNLTGLVYEYCTVKADSFEINLPKVKVIGDGVLSNLRGIKGNLYLPEVEEIQDYFLKRAEIIRRIDLPKVKRIGDSFLENGLMLEEVNMPMVEIMGIDVFKNCQSIKYLELPKVSLIGLNFMQKNMSLQEFVAPELGIIDPGYFEENPTIKDMILERMEKRNRRLK